GGALFAIEVVKRKTSMKLLGSIIIASVIGTFVGQLLLGRQYRLAGFPPIEYANPELILFCIIGGITAGLVSAAWIKFFYKMEDLQKGLYQRARINPAIRPAIGGLGVGAFLVILFLVFGDQWTDYTIMGVTYQPIKDIFTGITTSGPPMTVILTFLVLIVVKMVATSLTLGSGGSGGVFAPTLFIGVFLGAVFGILADIVFDFPVSAVPLFAMVGMAAFFAGTFRAPFTAVIMTAEITGNFFLAIPLLFAVVASTLVSWRLEPDDIYIKKLLRRGINIGDDTMFDVLDTVMVSQVMKAPDEIPRLDVNDTVSRARAVMEESGHLGVAIFDGRQFKGVLTFEDIAIDGIKVTVETPVRMVMNAQGTKPLICITENATLAHAEAIMAFHDVSKLPVALKDESGKPVLQGWITNQEIRAAYAKQHKTFDSADVNQYMLLF
nr:chloride channel protein [Candidatus Sigynarchaeota archaeon]